MAHRYVGPDLRHSPLTSTGSIASFQAIMHVLSELRNPLFDAPDRQRALRALQMSRILKENNAAKAWQAVRNMIDRAVAEHNSSPRGQLQSQNTYANPTASMTNTVPGSTSSDNKAPVYPILETIPSYAYQNTSRQFGQQAVSAQAQPMRPEPQVLQPIQYIQGQSGPCWDDINLNNINNIVGDVQPTPGVIPDFDFVSACSVEVTDAFR